MPDQVRSSLLRRAAPLLLLAALVLLAACQPVPEPAAQPGWAYADLRALDAADAAEPALDLLAAYFRRAGEQWQFRLDLLDFDGSEPVDLYLALDTAPGGSRDLPLGRQAQIAWDVLLILPPSGPIRAVDSGMQPIPGLSLRVVRDPVYDTIEISLPVSALPGRPALRSEFRLEGFTSAAKSGALADSIGPLRSGGRPPQAVQTLIAFWDALPAYSPRETLRRWDGAHTGPLGGRHGLYNLLRMVRASSVPVFLLDLKTPASLAALEYAGGMELAAELAASGLLGLPESLPALLDSSGQPVFSRSAGSLSAAQQRSLESAAGFGLSSDGSLFAAEGVWAPQSRSEVIFTPVQGEALEPVLLHRCAGKRIVPVRGIVGRSIQPDQAALDGPTLVLRRSLAAAATENRPGALLLLGGDLPATTWGNPQIARSTLRYLAAHPWIDVLRPAELAGMTAGAGCESLPAAQAGRLSGPAAVLGATALDSPALDAWFSLSSPAFPHAEDLPALRLGYTGLIDSLAAVEAWAAAPYPRAACEAAACILASDSVYAQFDPADGSLLLLFAHQNGRLHQLSGPYAQLASGQSDPASWDLAAGSRADPASLWGAFGLPQAPSQVSFSSQRLTFVSGEHRRVYSLLPDGLQVSAASPGAAAYRLPLLLDPWERFRPDWAQRYRQVDLPQGWSWQLEASSGELLTLSLETDAALSAATFLDSSAHFSRTEDPNVDYPPGHGLPFPVALVEIRAEGRADVSLRLIP